MKLIHLSDLHLGKRVNGFSLLEDQKFILRQILDIIERERPAAVMIAGDVYDKAIAPTDALVEWDDFLNALIGLHCTVLVISGNHDSPERLSEHRRMMEQSGVYFAPRYTGKVRPVTLTDAYGPVNFYLLPFVKPAHVREAFPEAKIETWTDAVRTAVDAMAVDPSERNVLIAHQFVTGAERCESEELSVGGADNVDAAVFDVFDYTALGHIHGPQSVGRECVRYCGTPLKYSFSEAGHRKSVTVVELGEKGCPVIRTVPLTPLRDMVELRGTYDELMLETLAARYRDQYVHITLTDELDIPDAMSRLRIMYPYLMRMDYDRPGGNPDAELSAPDEAQQRSPLALLEAFYLERKGTSMTEEQRRLAQECMEKIWEEAE